MNKFLSLFPVVRIQLSDWIHSSRTLISLGIIFLLTYMNSRDLAYTLEYSHLYAHIGEAIVYYLATGFGNFLLVSAIYLVMISEIPRKSSFQYAVLIRTNRKAWYFSQVLSCFFIVLVSVSIILLLSIAFSIPFLTPGKGWSDSERMLKNVESESSFLPSYITAEPIFSVAFLSGAILYSFWLVMTLSIFIATLCNRATTGLLIFAFILSTKVTILWESISEFSLFFPTDYATLINISYIPGVNDKICTAWHALIVYIIIEVAEIMIGWKIICNKDLCFISEARS